MIAANEPIVHVFTVGNVNQDVICEYSRTHPCAIRGLPDITAVAYFSDPEAAFAYEMIYYELWLANTRREGTAAANQAGRLASGALESSMNVS
jgi:hypothetical protein